MIEGHRGSVNDVVFSPDGTRLYTASADGTIRVWDAGSGTALGQIVHHGFGVNALALAEDGSWLAYGAVDGGTRAVALPGGEVIGDFTLDRRPILALAYHEGAKRLAVGDAEGYIMMLDTIDWRIADDFRATLKGPVWALAFSPDGANIHAGGLDNAMYSWPVDKLDGIRIEDEGQSFLTPPMRCRTASGSSSANAPSATRSAPMAGAARGRRCIGTLWRKAGTVAGYPYSDRLERGDIVWSDETVDRLFDLGPDHFIPGSKMPMQRITGDGDRADLIAFLKEATAR